jgi:RNA polymerase sigma-70 factor (sigma-E family)
VTDIDLSQTAGVASVSAHDGQVRNIRTQRRLLAAYEEHASRLGRLAYLLTGDAGLAEDLVHEAFVRAFARYEHLRRPEAIGSYLRRTVVNLAGKQLRRAHRERAMLERARANPAAPSTDPDVEVRELLWSALQQLPYRQRAALVLRFYEDLSEGDAARVLGCRTGTVKSLLHRGLKAMRAEIGGEI